jgi:hypothetical protein
MRRAATDFIYTVIICIYDATVDSAVESPLNSNYLAPLSLFPFWQFICIPKKPHGKTV